ALSTLSLHDALPIFVVMIAVLGRPDVGLVVCGYLGALSLGATLLAFGTLVSSLSSDQIVAFVSSALVAFVFVLTGDEKVAAVLRSEEHTSELQSRSD